jgi:hypothetical protein
MQSGKNGSFGLLPGGAGFWISVILGQARSVYRFFLFAKFPSELSIRGTKVDRSTVENPARRLL